MHDTHDWIVSIALHETLFQGKEAAIMSEEERTSIYDCVLSLSCSSPLMINGEAMSEPHWTAGVVVGEGRGNQEMQHTHVEIPFKLTAQVVAYNPELGTTGEYFLSYIPIVNTACA